jgi:hypothetical protein
MIDGPYVGFGLSSLAPWGTPYLSYTFSVVLKSSYKTTIAGIRLTRSWSAAEARWTGERRHSPEYALEIDVQEK